MNDIIGKYIKDEEGNIISPITSVQTIYDGNENLKDKINICTVCLAVNTVFNLSRWI